MQSASMEEIAMDSLLEAPFAPIRTYQSIMTEMCNCTCSRPNIVNMNYRDFTEKSFKTRMEVVETAKKAEAIVRLYEISKRVKKGTHDADVINFIMDNQQTSITLVSLREGEKNHIQEIYCMIDWKSGNNAATSSSTCLGDVFGTALTRTTHRTKPRLHIMLWWHLRNQRASISRQLTRGPTLWVRLGQRSASARTTTQSLLLTKICLLRTSSLTIYSRSWGRYSRTPSLRKRTKDKDAEEIATADTTRS